MQVSPIGKHTGPFLVFINDLPSTITVHPWHLFLLMIQSVTNKSYLYLIFNSFKMILIYFLHSPSITIYFNFLKFVFISFHCKFNSVYTNNGHTIPLLSSCKDLGIIFNNTLSWRENYEAIICKAYKSLGLLHRVFKDSHSHTPIRQGNAFTFHLCEVIYHTAHHYGGHTCYKTSSCLRECKEGQ